ncbi:hypothetical protein BKA00_006105 [Actinomadura coerulea]|uniref:Uncharacterized protein n=1 Tax=Actinomadura coerulea TaxID=46159 RepID=A0A7X0G6J1_9ACTN|nr:hypothetical protein [Actinomadura coerulea]
MIDGFLILAALADGPQHGYGIRAAGRPGEA